MANVAPATLTITSTIGPGQSVAAAKFYDVTNIEVDFLANTIKITRGDGVHHYDYSAMATLTWTISSGVTTIVISS